jgi:hypothetical protein
VYIFKQESECLNVEGKGNTNTSKIDNGKTNYVDIKQFSDEA